MDNDVRAELSHPPENVDELEELLNELDGTGEWQAFAGWSDNTEAQILHDNLRRAGFAARILVSYSRAHFGLSGEEWETLVGDLLCDMMHLCDLLGVDFDAMVEKGRFHYDAELRGDL